MRSIVSIAIVAFAAIAAAEDAKTCGEERWAAKTLSDPSSKTINVTAPPVVSPISALVSLPAPSKWSNSAPRSGHELQVTQVTGNLVGYKLEADSDFHIVIADDTETTMIVEIPSPDCVKASGASPAAVAAITNARAAFLRELSAAKEPAPTAKFFQVSKKSHKSFHCIMVGPLFFDKLHGQVGVARNGIEIHPVLDVKCEPVVVARKPSPDAGHGDE